MLMSSRILRRVLFYGSSIGLLLLSSQGFGLSYFSNEIDYWKAKKAKEAATKEIKKKKGFQWEKYLDPKHDEFFKEGDYTPPKPFMELARDPSDQNIKNWFSVIEKKNELMRRLQAHVKAYLEKNGKKIKPKEKALLEQQVRSIEPSDADIKRFRFRLYFDSQCPHCEKMMTSMGEIKKRGYFVEIRQIDNKKAGFPIPFPLQKATKKELKAKKIEAWPVLFVADTSKKKLYRINGYHPSHSIMQTLFNK